MAKLTSSKRQIIAADVRAGKMTQTLIAETHGVSKRTVQNIASEVRAEPTKEPQSAGDARIEKLVKMAERALDLAETSGKSRDVSDAVRAATATLQSVRKMQEESSDHQENKALMLVESVKEILVTELKSHPRLRSKIAKRLMVLEGPVK